ncbi:MAG: NUDIX hydrolase domain-like protein [Benjaminiella poitrasii]|nr:MAG: NUDIX hydrolase domain-like protein [Benjaminiella poitrasii]
MSLISSKKLLTLIFTINNEKQEILLGMKKRGFGEGKFNGFGGKVEKGETIEEAAIRELWEECEIRATELKRVGILMFTFENDPVGLETHVYTIDSYEGEPKETEEMKPEWFSFDQIPFDKMWQDDRYWLPLLLRQQLFTGHFHLAEDQKSILKQDLKPVLIDRFDLEQIQ